MQRGPQDGRWGGSAERPKARLCELPAGQGAGEKGPAGTPGGSGVVSEWEHRAFKLMSDTIWHRGITRGGVRGAPER